MNLLEQCRNWYEEGQYQKILDALEAIPAEERTPEMDRELARAYLTLGRTESDREALKEAIRLLEPHEEHFKGDYDFNLTLANSWYALGQEGRALPYFERALGARPDDTNTVEMIRRCRQAIALPLFPKCFRQRTEDWWKTFAATEQSLRQEMEESRDHRPSDEVLNWLLETLEQVFDKITFELGFQGDKPNLVLTPEGDRIRLFELVYFAERAPKEVLEHWNILVGRQAGKNIGLWIPNVFSISGKDIHVWLEERGKNRFALSVFCEKLLPMLREREGQAWWILTTVTDQVLGEIAQMKHIVSFDVLTEPKPEPFLLLSQLPDQLKERGLDLFPDPQSCLDQYTAYQMKPNEDPDANWRLDVIAGSTNCTPLINSYLAGDNTCMDKLHADGVVAGFFCYPLNTLREQQGSKKIFVFRDKLEEALTTGDGPEALTLIGGATGLFCAYVDIIAWDLDRALRLAKAFFDATEIPWACFHTFRLEAGTVYLKGQ